MEIKGFPQRSKGDSGVQFALVTKVRPESSNPKKERNHKSHVEAHKSASEPCPARRAGAPNHVYPECASDDGQ
jgi:hypothetical protein